MKHAPIDMAALAKETAERMTAVAKQAYVRVYECPYCDGRCYAEDGSRCCYCGGKGRIATEGAEP